MDLALIISQTTTPNYLLPANYIHPDSIAGQLGLTPEELAPIEQDHREFLREFAQPPTRPAVYHNHHTPAAPLPPPQPQPNPTPYDPRSTPAYLAQLGYTPEELEELDRECIREQAELLAIDDAEYRAARRDRELRSKRGGNNMGEAEERTGQAEVREVREIGPGGDQDQARWVPNYPTSHSQPTPQTYETQYEPPVDATSHNDDPIDRVDSPDHTGRYQLPTPTAHPELERHAYEGYGIADEHAVVASSDDYEGDDTYNRGDPPPTRFHTQPPPPWTRNHRTNRPITTGTTQRATTTRTPPRLSTTNTRATR
jgi:hypothetical protein